MNADEREPRPHARGKRIAFRLAAIGFGFVVALGLAEVTLRAFDVRPPTLRTKTWLTNGVLHFHCYPSNPHGEFQPVPPVTPATWKLFSTMIPPARLPLDALASTPWCVEYRPSSLGLRDHEYAPRPDPQVVRIAGIGDSFAMGEGVPLMKSLFKQMQTLHGPGAEFVNGAQVGISLAKEVEILKDLAPRLGCTRAIVVVIPNDVEQTDDLRRQQDYIDDLINIRDEYLATHEQRSWYSGSLRLVELVGSALERSRITRRTVRWYRDLYDERKNGANLARMGRDFEQIARVPGCRSVVVIYPLMQGLEDGYPLRDVHATIARLARAAGLATLDLEPVFRGCDTEAMQVHPCDHHPNGAAHAKAARAILDWLHETQPDFLPPR